MVAKEAFPVGAVSGREKGAADGLIHRGARFAVTDRSHRGCPLSPRVRFPWERSAAAKRRRR